MAASSRAESALDTAALRAARAQRADLHRVLIGVEKAITGPVPGRLADWAVEVHDQLVDVAATFERHIAVTEGVDGVINEAVSASPRLANAAQRLRDEHAEIRRTVADTLEAIRKLDPVADGAEAEAVRESTIALLARLTRHRQRGADLVYEAYTVDIGGSD